MNKLVKRSAVRAFEVSATVAVILNVLAAAVAIKRDYWDIAFAYFLIASVLAGVLALHWYVQHRQVPYRWRDEGWGLERWRESHHERDDDEEDDEYGGYHWDDDDRRN